MSEPYGNRSLTEGKRPDLVRCEHVGLGHVTGNTQYVLVLGSGSGHRIISEKGEISKMKLYLIHKLKRHKVSMKIKTMEITRVYRIAQGTILNISL